MLLNRLIFYNFFIEVIKVRYTEDLLVSKEC